MHLSRLYFSNILKHHLASSSLQHPLFCRIWKKKTTTWSSSYKMSNASCRNLAVLETRTLRSCCSCRKHWGQKSQTCTNFMNKLLPPFAKSLTASKHLLTVQIHSYLFCGFLKIKHYYYLLLLLHLILYLKTPERSSDMVTHFRPQWYVRIFQAPLESDICFSVKKTCIWIFVVIYLFYFLFIGLDAMLKCIKNLECLKAWLSFI